MFRLKKQASRGGVRWFECYACLKSSIFGVSDGMLRAMLVSSCRLIGSRHGRMVNLETTNGEGKALVDKTILVNLAAVGRFDRVTGTCRETPSCGDN